MNTLYSSLRGLEKPNLGSNNTGVVWRLKDEYFVFIFARFGKSKPRTIKYSRTIY